jgi:putative membrane protein
MTRALRHHAFMLLMLPLFALPAYAQTGTGGGTGSAPITQTPSSSTDAQLARADRGFLEQAAQNGHAEIEASRLAVQKSGDPQVKRFAQTMIDEHTRMGQELQALARSKGMDVPQEPSMMQKARLKLLSTSDGDDFTRRYVDSFGLEAHRDTIKLFQEAARDAQDPEVKAFASRGMPALQRHLTMAGELPQGKGGNKR